ncbi:cystathionine beta-synthase [Polaribacter sp. Hel_I_88]|uniref:cystathionine beta-synthase n=1 Tax=Polaribacter sp. Hel_I_88 TaxID=1250006 RepID=UPI000478F8FB|nr:cystathionine beta-synthase [Polaribacter sp. Hel_I_88]
MQDNKMLNYIENVLKNMPKDWLNLTTHRLDIYNEELAKTDFLNQFEELFKDNNSDITALKNLPTAYDYIRLGHPLSCVLEWAIANLNNTKAENVISFSAKTTPILAILRTNLLKNKKAQILYTDEITSFFDAKIIREIYGYNFEMKKIDNANSVSEFDGTTVFISSTKNIFSFDIHTNIDFYINLDTTLGSILCINGKENENYISDIQHVRRRETIAMTPSNSLVALQSLVKNDAFKTPKIDVLNNKKIVLESIKEITGTNINPLVASSGLSIQYAIMMGLIHDAQENYPEKAIKFIVPPNCYGGTNDQARRVADCLKNVEIVDLPVDGNNEMVQSIETVLTKLATEDAVPFIIAEIPTNPRVEVPNLIDLKNALSKKRFTEKGEKAIEPVFILDQTFCPNVHFLGEGEILSEVKTISYASGSKFPSGGKCTAGYCVGNDKTTSLMEKIDIHLQLCDNEATHHQMEILAEQLPSMNQRIADAYKNTREFVNFIQEKLPEAKINFVSEKLANQSFTPSVFSLDLPTKGNTDAERETYKRALNLKLINLMITKIPNESKFCVSYGQLKGCYWTIPATSTQGTTKEGDKDYIVRTSVSGDLDLEKHKQVFLEFVNSI